MDLPPALRAALAAELGGVPAREIVALVAELSARYRSDTPSHHAASVRSPEEAAAYAAFRLPATYAAAYAALAQARDRLPDWHPRTLLDAGAGPGTAAWAALAVWPSLERITCVEREPAMIALGRRLAAHSGQPAIVDAQWQTMDLAGPWEAPAHDLIIAAYVLGELSSERGAKLVRMLWQRTMGVLLIVEPGTPAGFARVRQTRAQFLAADATTLAPCPHDRPCPMPAADWCHFAQRVARSHLHRQAKSGELPYEDEKFAYVAVSRQPGTPIGGRVLRHPLTHKGHIQLALCTPDGLTTTMVTRKDPHRLRQARDLRWGSAVLATDPDGGF
jgi:ribosomal protein RSM22 (predicted rRNA methylase)